MVSYQDKAVEQFYLWDYGLRGYALYPVPVAIEPPFEQLVRQAPVGHEDDGRVPTIFQKVLQLIAPQPKLQEGEEHSAFQVKEATEYTRCTITLNSSRPLDIPSKSIHTLLSQLVYTNAPLSFEILASSETLRFQFSCAKEDEARLVSHLKAYLPSLTISTSDVWELGFSEHNDINILDFGLQNETVLPIATSDSKQLHDPLSSFIASTEHLERGEVALLQLLFHGVIAPFAQTMRYAVSDGHGGSFFVDSPEMVSGMERKTSSPLFATVFRVATQSSNPQRNQWLSEELARSISITSQSEHNCLVPLSNKEYEYNQHVANLYKRQSNRLGMLLNIHELTTFIHYPNSSVRSSKLSYQVWNTKVVIPACIGKPYVLGLNQHERAETVVSVDDEQKLRHTHIIGATGTGKSTLIAHLMGEDVRAGNGCVLFDPHGDIAEEVLAHIPEHRINDVIFIDPSDTDYPIGFNLLHADTEAQKIVLSSDLLSAFREHATSWGDQMTAIFSNTINAFLDHEHGGTLLELKRFLLEKDYRTTFLKGVSDPSLLYYFEHEYKLASRASLTPLLTRIDTFLRPKIIRYMLAQKNGLDFRAILDQRKILIIKLAQGLIGEENSYLLGTLLLTKLLQSAQERQGLPKAQRHPLYVYIDEVQHFLSPSITHILSGARKYGLGLVLAHQELSQIDEPKILGSLMSNPTIRICFKLGGADAKRLEQSFSSFEAQDFQSLRVGEAIASVGGTQGDFSLITYPPQPSIDTSTRMRIVEHTRNTYATSREDIEVILSDLLPKTAQHGVTKDPQQVQPPPKEVKKPEPQPARDTQAIENPEKGGTDTRTFDKQKEAYLNAQTKEAQDKHHKAIQKEVKKLGQEAGFVSTIEKNIAGGKRIDVYLERSDISIACEVSVSNTVDYELTNIEKCLPYASVIIMISPEANHLEPIRVKAQNYFDIEILKRLHFLSPDELPAFIQSHAPKQQSHETIIRGYRVKTEYSETNPENFKEELKRVVDRLKKAKK